jgi:GR25 family glycosyltransferase involved in LPS biosynthesis
MTVHVLNLDRDSERLATFLTLNAHVPDIVRVSAVDGTRIDRGSLHELGMISQDLEYTAGNIGSALSHVRFWRRALRENCILTVAEDDAIFARNFHPAHDMVLKRLPADWGFILWGWNFDAEISVEILEGVAAANIRTDHIALRTNVDIYRKSEIAAAPFRLHRAFGFMAYSVSPAGARVLLETCLPLSNCDIRLDDQGTSIRNRSIDCITNAAYRLMKSYICIPPLAISEHRRESSRTLAVI